MIMAMAEEPNSPIMTQDRSGLIYNVIQQILSNPLNIGLVFVISFLIYKIFKARHGSSETVVLVEKPLPKLKKRDFTIEELKQYDGTGEDGRVLVAVNGKVFDVTKGKRFYGPGGPYAAFGGRDASRGLATFSVTGGSDTYDDLSDLSAIEMDSVREWEMQFTEKYDYVGRLLKPGQSPNNYSDEEDEPSTTETAEKSKDE